MMKATSRHRFATGIPAVLLLGMMLALVPQPGHSVEKGTYRLLSITRSLKLILISQIPSSTDLPTPRESLKSPEETKYLLDATAAKITVDGKPAEFNDLQLYSLIVVSFELRESKIKGVRIDGAATELNVISPDKPIIPPEKPQPKAPADSPLP